MYLYFFKVVSYLFIQGSQKLDITDGFFAYFENTRMTINLRNICWKSETILIAEKMYFK